MEDVIIKVVATVFTLGLAGYTIWHIVRLFLGKE
jgi:hypothetical protein